MVMIIPIIMATMMIIIIIIGYDMGRRAVSIVGTQT